jgi:hypothetical protein
MSTDPYCLYTDLPLLVYHSSPRLPASLAI